MSNRIWGSPRREMVSALVLLVIGSAMVLLASTQDWVGLEADVPGGAGAEVAPAARALGLVGLAGVVAVPATRAGSRRVTGAVLTLVGLGAVTATVLAEAGPDALGADPNAAIDLGPWWLLSLAGGGCIALAGLLAAWRGGAWAAMGARYDAPGAGQTEEDTWAVLDRGEDPTDRSGEERRVGNDQGRRS